MRKVTEYKTVVQSLWRDATSEHFNQPNGIYNAPTAPLSPPPAVVPLPGTVGQWVLHSVVPMPSLGEPKLLVVWQLEVRDALEFLEGRR